jgi:hypothetical protein
MAREQLEPHWVPSTPIGLLQVKTVRLTCWQTKSCGLKSVQFSGWSV